MNKIIQSSKQKLQSQKGASIVFAMLLFLICAVFASALIVTGTGSAGRLIKVSEMDERYYSVASAAQLIINELDGQTVSAQRIKTITQEYDVDDSTNPPTVTPKEPSIDYPSFNSVDNLLSKVAYLVFAGAENGSSITRNDTWFNNINNMNADISYPLVIDEISAGEKHLNDAKLSHVGITFDIKHSINNPDTLTVTVTRDGYKVVLDFAIESYCESTSSYSGDTETITKTDTMVFHFVKINKYDI